MHCANSRSGEVAGFVRNQLLKNCTERSPVFHETSYMRLPRMLQRNNNEWIELCPL